MCLFSNIFFFTLVTTDNTPCLSLLLKCKCSGMHRLNTSEVSPCGEASSRWSSEPCALCVNAVLVWIVLAKLCVKLAQYTSWTAERKTEIVPLHHTLPQLQSSCKYPCDQKATYSIRQGRQSAWWQVFMCIAGKTLRHTSDVNVFLSQILKHRLQPSGWDNSNTLLSVLRCHS